METGLHAEKEEDRGDEFMSDKKRVEKEAKKPNALLSMTVKLTEEYPREIYDTNITLYTKSEVEEDFPGEDVGYDTTSDGLTVYVPMNFPEVLVEDDTGDDYDVMKPFNPAITEEDKEAVHQEVSRAVLRAARLLRQRMQEAARDLEHAVVKDLDVFRNGYFRIGDYKMEFYSMEEKK